MTVMIPRQSIKVMRDGQPALPEIGQPFDFTDDEIAEIEIASPDALESPDVRGAKKLIEKIEGAKAGDGKPAPRGKGKAGDGDLSDL